MSSPIASASSTPGLETGSVPQSAHAAGDQQEIQADEVAAAAVDLARAAAEDVAEPGTVGRYLGARPEGPGLVLHTFESLARGYRGWQWAVSLAHVDGSDDVTVCDSVLLPGDEAVLAPDWVPWSDRLAPGDLGAGDELPYREDDPLLVPGFTITDEDDEDQAQVWELGLGRVRVLGREGRDEAAQRWYTGDPGPASDVAVQAPAQCITCGYFIALSGSLRLSFGVCANEWSPSDASVVSVDHGCGAHSETDLAPPEPEQIPEPIVDDGVLDVLELEPEPDVAPDVADVVAEPAAVAEVAEVAETAEGADEPVAEIEVLEPEPEPLVTIAGVDEAPDMVAEGAAPTEIAVTSDPAEAAADVTETSAEADVAEADDRDVPPAP